MPDQLTRALRLGVAGPVGTGKTSLIAVLCRELGASCALGVITNDIYTDEDARFLRAQRRARRRADRGGRDRRLPAHRDPRRHLRQPRWPSRTSRPTSARWTSSSSSPAATTSPRSSRPRLVDAQIFVLDVAGGGDVPRKGGPGIARADLLVDQQDRPRAATSAPTSSGWSARRASAAAACRSLRSRCAEGPGAVADWVREQLAAYRDHGHLHSSVEGVPDHHHDHVH